MPDTLAEIGSETGLAAEPLDTLTGDAAIRMLITGMASADDDEYPLGVRESPFVTRVLTISEMLWGSRGRKLLDDPTVEAANEEETPDTGDGEVSVADPGFAAMALGKQLRVLHRTGRATTGEVIRMSCSPPINAKAFVETRRGVPANTFQDGRPAAQREVNAVADWALGRKGA